jgi:hypothetical protein
LSHTPTVRIAGVVVDEFALDLVTIRYGRKNSRSKPAPTTCTIGIVWKSAAGEYDILNLRLGALVEVDVIVDGFIGPVTVNRFTGAITDVDVGKNSAQVVAVSNVLARLARSTFDASATNGIIPSVVEDLFAEITAQNPDLGITLTTPDEPENEVSVDLEAQNGANALEALEQAAAADPAAFLYEQPATGALKLSTGAERLVTGLVTALSIPEEAILDSFRIRRSVAGRVNRSTVTWLSGSESADYGASVAQFGPYPRTTQTRINNDTDAALVAQRIVNAGSSNGWELEAIPVEVPLVAGSIAVELFLAQLTINRLLQLPPLPAGLPEYPGRVWLEGWDETISRARWTLDLHITDPLTVGWPQIWNQVTNTLKWSDLAGPAWSAVTGTWADVANFQRWADYSPTWEALQVERI